jgi:enoyl-CoA hydratase
MEFKNILLEFSDDMGILKINRPTVMNALNLETVKDIFIGIKKLEENKGVKVIIITGNAEKVFVAGADIAAMKEMSKDDAEEFSEQGHRCMQLIEECSKPVIAAVNGYALGGGTELALACDFIYASDNAKFGLPEVKLGIFPGFGGTQRLPRAVGMPRSRELIFTGRIITAQEAFEWGMVNKVVPREELMNEVRKVATEIAANGIVAVGLAKRSVNVALRKFYIEGMEFERKTFVECFTTNDRLEGMSAFLEKRKPDFKGR